MFETLRCESKNGLNIAGARLEGPVRKLLAQQREKLHSKGEAQQVLSKLNSRLFSLGIISISISIGNGIGIGRRLMFVLQGGSVISSVFEIFVLSMVGLSVCLTPT